MELVVLEIAPPEVALRSAPLGVFSCVETVKRLLGLRTRWVFTPWQLHRFLVSRHIAGCATANGDGCGSKELRTKQENNLDSPIETI